MERISTTLAILDKVVQEAIKYNIRVINKHVGALDRDIIHVEVSIGKIIIL